MTPKMIRSRGCKYAIYDLFKADIYALGITIL